MILNEINFNNVFQDYNKFVCLNLRTSNFHNDKGNSTRNNYDLKSFNKLINYFKDNKILIVTNLITKNNDLEKNRDILLFDEKLVLNLNNIEISSDKKSYYNYIFSKFQNLQWAVIQDQILFHFYLIKNYYFTIWPLVNGV